MITCDHIRFYEEENLFSLEEGWKTITLDASLSSNLEWERQKEQAAQTEKKILWHLSFNLEEVSLDSPLSLSSFLVAIKTFGETVFPSFASQTLGVLLYEGPLLKNHSQTLEDKIEEVTAFSSYLHRLAAALPDEALPITLFKAPQIEESELAQLLSREHFPFLFVGLKEHPLPIGPFCHHREHPSVGVAFPLHEKCSKTFLTSAQQCLKWLEEQKIPYRILFESHLTESWDELDHLIVFSSAVSSQGKRKMQGFAAAGGGIITVGEKMGMPIERSWEEFRGRGI